MRAFCRIWAWLAGVVVLGATPASAQAITFGPAGPQASSATTVTAVAPQRPRRGALTRYRAQVAPPPADGTVSFSVDGTALVACAARPVDPVTGEATCDVLAPPVRGSHVLAAEYSGGTHHLPSVSAEQEFTLAAPALVLPASFDFGPVAEHTTAIRTVILRNDGDDTLELGSTTVSGEGYGLHRTDCSWMLRPGEFCTVEIALLAAAPGAPAGALDVGGDLPGRVALGATVFATPPKPTLEPARWVAGRKVWFGRAFPLAILCPPGPPCKVSGKLSMPHGSVRFADVVIPGGARRTVKVRTPPKALRAARRSGRAVKVTLTLVTVRLDATASSRQRATVSRH